MRIYEWPVRISNQWMLSGEAARKRTPDTLVAQTYSLADITERIELYCEGFRRPPCNSLLSVLLFSASPPLLCRETIQMINE